MNAVGGRVVTIAEMQLYLTRIMSLLGSSNRVTFVLDVLFLFGKIFVDIACRRGWMLDAEIDWYDLDARCG